MEVQRGANRAIVPYVFPIPVCPLMRPELGFMEFVNSTGSTLFLSSFPLPFLLVSHPLIPSRVPGPVYTKMDAQDASRPRLRRT
jgi:hypothetical protein